MPSTATIFTWLHRRGIVRAVSSESSNATNSPVDMRFETWPRVPQRAVAFFADHHFRDMYPLKARTYCRRSMVSGDVTVTRRRQWVIKYGPSMRSQW